MSLAVAQFNGVAALEARFPGQIVRREPLAKHTTFRIGGPAELFLAVESAADLQDAVTIARRYGVPFYVIGGGSNILVADRGIDGLVIEARAQQVTLGTDYVIYAEAGAPLAGVARKAIAAGWGGLEWAVSVPGTVGGAVVGNAGAHDSNIANCLWRARLLGPEGVAHWHKAEWFSFGYRRSRIKGQYTSPDYVVLAAEFRLIPHDRDDLRRRADQFLARRRATQPTDASSGSVFKNPPGDYAGRLVEAVGLKGARVGQAQISPTHANFIVNMGGATAEDVGRLMQRAQHEVRERFGVRLEPEIVLLGDFG